MRTIPSEKMMVICKYIVIVVLCYALADVTNLTS